jgi:hypothetical protein
MDYFKDVDVREEEILLKDMQSRKAKSELSPTLLVHDLPDSWK